MGALVQGAAIGGAGNAIAQAVTIARNKCKSASDFNVGSVIGSSIGGAMALLLQDVVSHSVTVWRFS